MNKILKTIEMKSSLYFNISSPAFIHIPLFSTIKLVSLPFEILYTCESAYFVSEKQMTKRLPL